MPKAPPPVPARTTAECCTYRPPRALDDVAALSELCKALGDPSRLQMLQLLAMAKRPLCVCELETQFDLSQPTISHHLKVLRDVGVVSAERRGTWVFYELNPGPLQLLRWLDQLTETPQPLRRTGRLTVKTEEP